jgi:hypothetical protein
VITKETLAEWPESKLHFPRAELVSEEGHDEGEAWSHGMHRDAMVRRRWNFDAEVQVVRDWYGQQLTPMGWRHAGTTSTEGIPVVTDSYERHPDSADVPTSARPHSFELGFFSAEEPDPPENYWPADGSEPGLHFHTTLVVPSPSRRWYPEMRAALRRDGKDLGTAREWVGVTGFHGIEDQAEYVRLRDLFEGHLRKVPEIDLSEAWDGEDRRFIRSRERFRWFMESYLPSIGYEVLLEEHEVQY